MLLLTTFGRRGIGCCMIKSLLSHRDTAVVMLSIKAAFEGFVSTGRELVSDEFKPLCRNWSIHVE